MLTNAKLQTIVWTCDIHRAENFYTKILKLPYVGKSHGALVYNVNGNDLRISPVPTTTPTEHTVLGFSVTDVKTVVDKLVAHGIVMERFPDFPQDDDGILSIPGGDRVSWFRDPDGNILSVVQYAG